MELRLGLNLGVGHPNSTQVVDLHIKGFMLSSLSYWPYSTNLNIYMVKYSACIYILFSLNTSKRYKANYALLKSLSMSR